MPGFRAKVRELYGWTASLTWLLRSGAVISNQTRNRLVTADAVLHQKWSHVGQSLAVKRVKRSGETAHAATSVIAAMTSRGGNRG